MACTETNRRFLSERYPGASIELIRHGLDPAPYRRPQTAREPGPCRLLPVGRIVEKKGFPYLLRACKILVDRDFPFNCVLVGDGPMRKRLETNIRESGLDECVTLAGALPHQDVRQHYWNADMLVVPSVVAPDGDRGRVPKKRACSYYNRPTRLWHSAPQ